MEPSNLPTPNRVLVLSCLGYHRLVADSWRLAWTRMCAIKLLMLWGSGWSLSGSRVICCDGELQCQ